MGKCECSFRIRLVGDGCQYCNPLYAAELQNWEDYDEDSEENESDEPVPYRITEAGKKALGGGE